MGAITAVVGALTLLVLLKLVQGFSYFTMGHLIMMAVGGILISLAIVKEYVARLNGSIAVESERDKGTTVRITLTRPDGVVETYRFETDASGTGSYTQLFDDGMDHYRNNAFEPRLSAVINVAGDADDPTGPTYWTFANVLNVAPVADGATITQLPCPVTKLVASITTGMRFHAKQYMVTAKHLGKFCLLKNYFR